MKKVVDILTSFPSPHKVSAIGNEAIARGAIEAGVNGVFSYPGTPSTEISEVFNLISQFQQSSLNVPEYKQLFKNDFYFEYSINEKIAMEKAIAFTIGHKSAMCIMKNVGMNIASDPLMSITYQTISAPLVIVVCDDPGCHSSSNEQDSRHWGSMASVPVLNPASPKDAYEMTKYAFALSAELKLPVIVRSTTRISHSRGMVAYNMIVKRASHARFERLPEHINIPARTATAHQKLLDTLNSPLIEPYFKKFNHLLFENGKKERAIISSGVATTYILEILQRNKWTDKVELFDIGLIHPFPHEMVKQFVSNNFNEILIVEELDPLIENAVRATVQKNGLNCRIHGKGFGGLSPTGELTLGQINHVMELFLNAQSIVDNQPLNTDNFALGLPPRPPVLCSGCPHRATYYALKLIVPRKEKAHLPDANEEDVILCGDIGCSGLGALAPLKMIDTINHMGMSISMAQGLSKALQGNTEDPASPTPKKTKVIAMLGDGTFFHSGIASLLNAVYTRSNVMVIIFDNRTIGMTGHQDHPGATHLTKYNEIDISPLVKGMGIEYVETLMPFDLKDTYKKLEAAIKYEGVSVLISKAPCVFLPDYQQSIPKDKQVVVDPAKCNTCHNHTDIDIYCSRKSGASTNLVRAIAKIKSDTPIDARDQSCPANICNHGFFNSILENDYKSALEMVRDKLLFARTCGDICHRPCELFSTHSAHSTIPIKQLKKYVSGIDEHFVDFSGAMRRIENAVPKKKNIAIIGAGPAGLSAAYDLIRDGYQVHVYEKESEAGGLIKYVIPDFRMDKSGFDFEVGQLDKMGVHFHFNTRLGRDIQLDKISEQNDAVILALGLTKPHQLEWVNLIPDDKKFDAISFLKSYNQTSLNIPSHSKVLIIGGGNSAIDAARSALKYDPTLEVQVSCIEKRTDMPAFEEEIAHALTEGVKLLPNSYVENCQYDSGIHLNIHVFDHKQPLCEIHCDYVIIAIGQTGNTADYASMESCIEEKNNKIKAHLNSGYTDYKNVFVAGDLCDDNHMSFIGAIASGKRAVIGIKQLLEGYEYDYEGLESLLELNNKQNEGDVAPEFTGEEDLSSWIRQFNLFQSCEKCNHCIDNLGCPAMIKVDGKIVIDQPKCTRCGLCIDVCPNDAIHWQKIPATKPLMEMKN